jgi:integrase/recombinase XerC
LICASSKERYVFCYDYTNRNSKVRHLDVFVKYLKFEKRYSDHTVSSYSHDLSQFQIYVSAHLGIADEIQIEHFHIRSWIVYLMKDQYASKSVNRKISSLKSYYKFLKRTGILSVNPAAKISGPKIPKRLPKVIRADSLHNLLTEKSERDDYKLIRDRMIVDLLYSTGIRKAELILLTDRDVDFERRQIKVLGKGNKERLIPINPNLIDKLKEYIVIRDTTLECVESCRLFITDSGQALYPKFVYNVVVKNVGQYSTSEKRGPHVLRHSFATHMADGGADLNAIKEIMGHASLASTEIYMHNTIDRLRSVYNKAHPKAQKK